MKLTDMISRVKRQLPAITSETDPDATITAELNHGVDEINLIAQCYRGELSATTDADVQIYSLSSKFDGYLTINKSGIWFFDDDGNSHYLFSKTKRWLDLNIMNWRDAESADVPTFIWIEGDELGFQPAPSGSNTIKAYATIKATPMDNGDNYPWKNLTTEVTALRCFDNAIIAYAVWKLSPSVFDKEGRNQYKQEFFEEVKRASAQIKRRADMTSDYDNYIRIDTPGDFLPS